MSEKQRIACGEQTSKLLGRRFERNGVIGKILSSNKDQGVMIGSSLSRMLERLTKQSRKMDRRPLSALRRISGFAKARLPWSVGNWQSVDLQCVKNVCTSMCRLVRTVYLCIPYST